MRVCMRACVRTCVCVKDIIDFKRYFLDIGFYHSYIYGSGYGYKCALNTDKEELQIQMWKHGVSVLYCH